LFKWYWDSFFGSCWTFNANETKYSTKAGKINGLMLKLYMPSVDDFYSFKTTESGAHVYIHNRSAVPVFFEGFDASVNTETNFMVSREFTSSLSYPFSDCVKDTSSFGSVFTNMFAQYKLDYTQQSCFK
jgi:hypothetical protein